MAENVAEPGGLDAATAVAAKPVEPSILNALPHFLPLLWPSTICPYGKAY